nr:zinc finger, CCHC-type [Tanacetum cinerariifolium]
MGDYYCSLEFEAFAASDKIYAHESLIFNNTVACEEEIWATKGLLDKAKGNILGMEIVRDQSGNTLRVSQSSFYNKKLVQTLLEGQSILSLEGSLSGDCDVEKNDKWSYVGKLDKFDRLLQKDVQVFVDFDYAMGRSITNDIHDTYRGCKKCYLAKGTRNRVSIQAKDSSGYCYKCLVKGGPQIEVTAIVEAAAY